jgi:methylenetetrahydrofolate dehydrogenase (NADP+)/methenyltetrahydrofolate cyclohydrolase
MLKEVCDQIVTLRREGHPPPALAEIWVGDPPLAQRWRAEQERVCRVTGISYRVRSFPLATDHSTILQALADLNADPTIAGIVVHADSPVATRGLAEAVRIDKDVAGSHPFTVGCFLTHKCTGMTGKGGDLLQLVKRAGVDLVGAHVVCIGNASGLASSFALRSLHENATITAWRSETVWPLEVIRQADVLVIDTDTIPGLDSSPLKPGVVIIDARTSADRWAEWEPDRWFDAVALLIPVPGGVGPTTVATRLLSLLTLYRRQIQGQPAS